MVIQFGTLNQNQFAGQSIGKSVCAIFNLQLDIAKGGEKCLHSWHRQLSDNLKIVVNLLEFFSK